MIANQRIQVPQAESILMTVRRMTMLSYSSENRSSVLEKYNSRSELDRVLNTEFRGLTAPSNIRHIRTAATLPFLNRDKVETAMSIMTTAIASTPEATTRLLRSKVGSNAPLALH